MDLVRRLKQRAKDTRANKKYSSSGTDVPGPSQKADSGKVAKEPTTSTENQALPMAQTPSSTHIVEKWPPDGPRSYQDTIFQRNRNGPLCEECRKLFDSYRWAMTEKRIEASRFHSPSQLVRSAEKCPSCYLFIKGTNSKGPQDVYTEEDVRRDRAYESGRVEVVAVTTAETYLFADRDRPMFKAVYRSKGVRRAMEYYLIAQDTNQKINYRMYTEIANTTDVAATWANAKIWIEVCMGSKKASALFTCRGSCLPHAECRKVVMERVLPTRLIEIGSGPTDLRLRLTKNVKNHDDLHYVTLSHCWGDVAMPLRTTRENLADMSLEIPYETLGTTFQHAITICNRLGFCYIWIDSLCILQGDEADWEEEASKMGGIYASCSLNIVASAAANGSDGCFFDRTNTSLHEFATNAGSVRLYASVRRDLPENQMATSQRAWCFQETFLAPRSLYFDRDRVYWQCRKLCADEVFPSGAFSAEVSSRTMHLQQPPLADQASSAERASDAQLRTQQWMNMVTLYSSRDLTYWSDRLVAISGCARLISSRNRLDKDVDYAQQHYLAGMWRVNMVQQLIWKALSPGERARGPDAPSWSWASLRAPIEFEATASCHITSSVDLVRAETYLSGRDDYGPVTGGILQLRCNSLARMRFERARIDGLYRLRTHNGLILSSRVFLDELPSWDDSVLVMGGWRTIADDGYTTMFGLLLRANESLGMSSTNSAKAFRRIGMFSVGSASDNLVLVDAALNFIGNGSMLKLLPYDQGCKQTVVTIV